MKVSLNPDAEIVKAIKEGLEKTGGYCPCRLERIDTINACARNSVSRSQILSLKAFATACFITKKSKLLIGT